MELSGNLPIPTALVTPEFLCALPFGWTTYVVQAGDTLYAIAEAAQTSVRALREANCLANIATLPVGLPLYVPNPVTGTPPTLQPVLPSSTPRPEDVQLALNLPAEGCTDPQARITSPVPGQVAGSMLTLFGTADSPRFAAYRLSVRSAATAAYSEYLIALQPVNGEALGQINPLFFGPGIHYVRLDVLDESGDPLAFCAIPVIFR
jgi:LysM repeat protein